MWRRTALSLGRRQLQGGPRGHADQVPPASLRMSHKRPARRIQGVEKNIWLEFTKMAADYKPVNLGQGFPNFSPPDFVRQAFSDVVSGEDCLMHQYTRAFGHPNLVKILAKLYGQLLGQSIDPFGDILVTVGAYQALFTAFQALVDEGDEVIIIEPFFDCYEPMVKMAGGRCVFVPLRPKGTPDKPALSSGDWALDPDELASKFTERTKAIVLNTPNNPLGKVFKREELQVIAELCLKHDVVCISDEVYEWIVFDDTRSVKIASFPGMWAQTVTIGSAGKTFSATGWKVGWAIGPHHILKHLQTVHQNSVYHTATAAQEAVARGFQRELDVLGRPESYFFQLPRQLQEKRNRLAECLLSVGMRPIIPEGGYFLNADISALNVELPDPADDEEEPYDYRFAKWLIKTKGLATIPVSAFYSPGHRKDFASYVRLCYVKEDSTLEAAEKILKEWHLTK
ncbi:LOW QUALITY PROTEIN: kynurenine--oxoglutarate transaminase 1-like [Polypterus senegalus]|uniref:LOW QUALITY PROTEIN: kynurenine--oxoglutarate transaminase 1-like n=1 Tax=Polypterus senegalus TaxID=55291 RepID=UPI001964988B|nr:LOW QUALITY PROTEIN: kynurenine--oxoglutarate transaminase 1-like [Polypterus senegalus]